MHLPRLTPLLVALVLVPALAHAAPQRRTRSSTRTKPPAAAPAPTTTEAPAAAPAPAPEPARAAVAPEPAPVQQRAAPAVQRAAPAAAPASSALRAERPMRLGLGVDLFHEGSRMAGEQWINDTLRDESFDYNSARFFSFSAYLLQSRTERLRIGPALRVFGNYVAEGRNFNFGLLNEVLALVEYGVPASERIEALLGARAGVAVLLPGGALSEEIRRLRNEGVDAWNVPRVGWVAGLSVGARRRMTDRIALRADLTGQLQKLYLFYTREQVEDLNFRKTWDTKALRLGVTLGVELGL